MSRLVLVTCALVLIGSLPGETGRCSLTGTVFAERRHRGRSAYPA